MRVAQVGVVALLLAGCGAPLRHLTPTGEAALVAEDERAAVSIVPEWRLLEVTVVSKTDVRMRVEWNEAVLVSPDGRSDPLILGSTKKINLGQPMPASVVYPGARAVERVLSMSSARGAMLAGWQTEEWRGRPWRVVIPVYVDGEAKARTYEVAIVSSLSGS